MLRARKYVIMKHFNGEPKKNDLKLEEEELPPIQDGGKRIIHFYIMKIKTMTIFFFQQNIYVKLCI